VTAPERPSRSSRRPARLTARRAPALWLLLPLFFLAIVLSHATLLRLPYFWDEGGYYIPAALDFFRTGTLIPQSTVTNAHPPLPSLLLAGWWRLFGFHILATRTLVCMVSACALLAVFRLVRGLLGAPAAWATTLLTAVYPIWFAQSTLAHADIFAAAFTLWGLSVYFSPPQPDPPQQSSTRQNTAPPPAQLAWAALLFTLAALAKETAIVTPLALALWEAILFLRQRRSRTSLAASEIARPEIARSRNPGAGIAWPLALTLPLLPLLAWYAYHRAHTGVIFGNPEFLRYNATANLDAHRILLCLWHRVLHLTLHMNLFVATLCTLAILLMPPLANRRRLAPPVLRALAVILLANLLEFSILGGALLTRYLLPMYPLVLLLCVAEWHSRVRRWGWLAALSAAGFLAGIWINPPYAFAPEDNLTYRDMVVLHERAIHLIEQRFPVATVLTAWPAAAELSRPELGYTGHPFQYVALQNFSFDQIEKAATDPGAFDTALLFSTKWAPPANRLNLGRGNQAADAKYFDFHLDLSPSQAAAILHGDVVWQASRKGEWVAVLRFPRSYDAHLSPLP
jgi:4-amino-4-deoxy-L-arabinose transferase-like glycosyltransferase